MEPLLEVKNSDLFCEKLIVQSIKSNNSVRITYATWEQNKTFVKEIEVPSDVLKKLKSAAEL
eukprot:CAMPEP_0176392258 /NCGR_PEP_ID=MMETSP0126-20121128/40716_1 /TAXON_ID=141414 ORGANISM="Strombidinopsis acuminatum, Strain SPMC142" /NCGR_SAMPLE_ID=MMETSP0126 /ASSEMBLY_ACC=CAM_ASM_000229 /LENGTH=61 /DNA_ID=CAMNT_0017762931 /DNA_START=1989 /DNA_END=2174 /DNA_ORIENTATION=-